MVQYAEIKEVEDIIKLISVPIFCLSNKDKEKIIYHLKKYHTILEGWYGDEQYHNKVEEGINL